MVSMHRYLAGGVVKENPFRSLGVVTTGAAHAAGRLELLRQGLYFLLFLFLAVCILDI
jgi:hypothetical protein